MSTASKLTLLGTTIGTIGIVAFVHWAQTAEKAVSEPSYLSFGAWADNPQGHARRRPPRYRAAANQTRATSRLRDATPARGGV
jgi:PET assembly of cytochrome c oxidase, mitochondrial